VAVQFLDKRFTRAAHEPGVESACRRQRIAGEVFTPARFGEFLNSFHRPCEHTAMLRVLASQVDVETFG
jgi:hypothetical protein